VFFNGKKAADIYRREVLPIVEKKGSEKSYRTLPSTSPAHAAISYAEKLEKWSVVASVL